MFAHHGHTEQDIKDWVQPDLVVVCDPNKIGDKRIVGCPDFVVEVLSPATAEPDRVMKYNAYAKAGVKQYWIVDPYHEFIETFIGKDGSFERSGQYFQADVITDSPFDRFRLDLKELFGEMG